LSGRRLGRDDGAEGGGEDKFQVICISSDFKTEVKTRPLKKNSATLRVFNVGRKGLEAKKSDDGNDGSPEVRPPVDQLRFYLFL